MTALEAKCARLYCPLCPRRARRAGERVAAGRNPARPQAGVTGARYFGGAALPRLPESIDRRFRRVARADLRTLVREQLKAGKSDQEIKTFLVDRYGNFVLLKPPFEWDTAALWLSPFALFAIAGFFVWRKSRTRKVEAAPAAPLSAEESEKLKALLDEKA